MTQSFRPVLLLVTLFLLCSVPAVGSAQVPAPAPAPTPADTVRRDTVAQQLPTIDVTVTRTPEPLRRLPAAVSVVDSTDVRRGQPTLGLDEALNNVPGMYVANRYNFSLDQRISIRGSGSRASFGTRGVKILVDGIPQTLPDGQSQLTNVEFGNIDRIEVLRGAASSLYGNASGGVISLSSWAGDPGPFSQYVRAEGGSFGLFKWQSRTSGRTGPVSGTLSISRTLVDGFREQSAADLRLLNARVDYILSGSTSLGLRFAAADDPQAQNPGALTPAEYAANPDSASASNIRRRADKDVNQQQLALILHHIGENGNEYTLAAFGFLRGLQNPLATPPPSGLGPTIGTYVAIDRAGGGLRGSTTARLGHGAWSPRLTGGVDFQYLRDDRRNFRSVAGVPTDSTLLDQRETVTEVGPFAQLNVEPSERLLLTAGARYDRVSFDVQDRHLSDGVDNSGSRSLNAVNGNAGASYAVSDAFVPYVNVSTAFETPTTTELANQPGSTGGFNDLLGPQRAWNYEVGMRGRIGRFVEYSAAGFLGRVRDAIVQYQEVGGRAYFRNAGKTHNNGVELGISVRPIPAVRIFGSYTFADYTFADYRVVTGMTVTVLDGNRLPGVPRHFGRLGVRSELGYGLTLDVDHTMSSALFADDANTFQVDGWGAGVTNVRMGWSGVFGRALVSPFVGVNNLFDKRYISSVTINGFDRQANAPRVIEPAPGINFYVGGEIGWRGH